MPPLLESIQISFLAMTVIFLVVGILIGVIRLLVHFLPYVEEPAPPARRQSPAVDTGTGQEEDHIAAIYAALAHHLGKAPQDIHIQHITSL